MKALVGLHSMQPHSRSMGRCVESVVAGLGRYIVWYPCWMGGVYRYIWYVIAHYACTRGDFAPYCCASASPFEVCPETVVHNPYNCSSHSSSDFEVYIIDSGQDWAATVILVNIMIT